MLNAGGFESIEEADSFDQLKKTRAARIGSSIILCLVRHSDEITQATNAVRACNSCASILFVLPKVEIDLVRLCYASGASGCVAETVSSEGLRHSLRLIAVGEKVFPSELASMLPLMAAKPEGPRADSPDASSSGFSQRESEILRLLAVGQSNKEIARCLDIAEATVKVHIKRIMRKAKLRNRTQAALWAVSTGIAAPPESAQHGQYLDHTSRLLS